MMAHMSTKKPDKPAPSGPSRAIPWGLVGGGIAALLAMVFVLQNTETGTIEFLVFEWNVGIWFGLLVTFLLGLLAGLLLPKLRRRKKD